MAHCTRVLLGVFAALAGALVWVAVVFGVIIFASNAFGLSGMSPETRTAVTIGVLGATAAGAITAAGVCFFLVVDCGDGPGQADPRHEG